MAKFGMSLCVLGMSQEFRDYNIGVNALWPRTAVATAAVEFALGGDQMMKTSRKDTIMGDAAYVILTSNSKTTNGQFFIDDEVLASSGVTDFNQYKVDPNLKDSELTQIISFDWIINYKYTPHVLQRCSFRENSRQ